MKQDVIAFLGIPIDNMTMDETVARIFGMIDDYTRDAQPRQVATVNVDFLVNTFSWRPGHVRHPELLNILRRADHVTSDGMPITWLSRFLGTPLKERVTGVDLIPGLAAEAAKREKSLYFLGGRDGVGEEAAEVLKHYYPDLRIAGIASPYVYTEGESMLESVDEDSSIIEEINSSGADILLVGFGNPKQEIWFDRNRKKIDVPVTIGIGGAYEFIAGSVKRAPEWMQKAGLEWIFRIIQDPKRLWKRYLIDFLKFGLMILPALLSYGYGKLRYRIYKGRLGYNTGDGNISQKSFTEHIKVIKLPVRLDIESINNIRSEIEQWMKYSQNTVIDFGATSFIDSGGLGFILRLWARAIKDKRAIYMTGMDSSLIRFFKFNRIWDLLSEITYDEIHEIVRIIRKKTILLSFHLFSEIDSSIIHIDLFGRLDADQMSTIDMSSIISEIGERDCIINMRELDFVDSTGLIFFLKIRKHLIKYNKVPILCGIPDNIRQMFYITKVITLFRIESDIYSAKKKLVDKNESDHHSNGKSGTFRSLKGLDARIPFPYCK